MTNGAAQSERAHTHTIWENRGEQVAMARPTARPSTIAHPRDALDDRELAQLAIAGDGEAFAQLYDRHERRVYGYCLRMLGTPDEAGDATQETFVRLLKRLPALEGREVNFVAYALTTARNACYDAIAVRLRAQPVAEPIEPGAEQPREIALDPERAALLQATREEIRAANARLPERQREVLALRELEQLSYEQIGEVVGLNDNAVAQLISRARIRLRAEIRGDALGSIATSSPDCERALELLARRQDAQATTAEETGWLQVHMDSCATCPLSRAAMQEAGASYRALGPIVVLEWLRHATIAHAARFVGADWSHLAGPSGERGAASSATAAAGVRRWLPAAAILGVCLLAILAVVMAGAVTPDGRVLPQRLKLDQRAVTRAQTGDRPLPHAVGPLRRSGAGEGSPRMPVQAGAFAGVSRVPNGRTIVPNAVTKRDRRVIHRKGTHRSRSSPPPPTNSAPVPQPASTTPTMTTPGATTPAASPPSGGSGGSNGSGPGTATGGGETPPPAETTPAGPPGGEPPKTTPNCALAIAC